MADRQQLIVKSLPSQPALPTAGQHPGAIVRYGSTLYWDDGAGVLTQIDRQTISGWTIDTQTASFTLGATDAVNGYVRANFSAPGTVTIPAGLTTSSIPIQISWVGTPAGVVTIAPGAGVTLRNAAGVSFPSGVILQRQGAIVSISQVAANVWELVGPTDAMWTGGVYKLISSITVNQTTLQSIMPAPAPGVAVGFKTVRAGTGFPGWATALFGGGLYNTPALPGNPTLAVTLGGTTLTSVTVPGLLGANAANLKYGANANVIFRSVGTTGVVIVEGYIYFVLSSGQPIQMALDSSTTMDNLSTDLALDIKFSWSNTQANQNIVHSTTFAEAIN